MLRKIACRELRFRTGCQDGSRDDSDGITRFGQRIGRGAVASFRCAACSEMARGRKVARPGTTIDVGPPLGEETYNRDAIILDYFPGTASKFADATTSGEVQEIVNSNAPVPVLIDFSD
jgi:hypothetical protein